MFVFQYGMYYGFYDRMFGLMYLGMRYLLFYDMRYGYFRMGFMGFYGFRRLLYYDMRYGLLRMGLMYDGFYGLRYFYMRFLLGYGYFLFLFLKFFIFFFFEFLKEEEKFVEEIVLNSFIVIFFE